MEELIPSSTELIPTFSELIPTLVELILPLRVEEAHMILNSKYIINDYLCSV